MKVFDQKTVIFSHYSATGATEELRDWLVKNQAKEVVYVGCPFGDSARSHVFIEIYRRGELVLKRDGCVRFKQPEPLAYLRDLFYLFFYGIRFCRKSDLLVAGDCLLALAGQMLRSLGVVRRVIYYVIDFTPQRYANPVLNRAYIALDRQAAYHADQTWPLCAEMMAGRRDLNGLDLARVNWRVVPYGNHAVASRKKQEKTSTLQLVYMGGVLKSKGAELFVPIARVLCDSGVDFRFHVVGGGADLEAVKAEADVAELAGCFKFHGFVDEFAEVLDVLAGCDIALAPYNPADPNNFTFYADPGKLKTYLGCGLPVVLTDVPPIAKEIKQNAAGQVAAYDAEQIASAILQINAHRSDYAARALAMGTQYDWGAVLTRAFFESSDAAQ
jgi:glycosyltransferase involved in cell wall biosynthesis